MLVGMDTNSSVRRAPGRSNGSARVRPDRMLHPHPPSPDSTTAPRPDAGQRAAARDERPAKRGGAFGSVICASDRTATHDAARRQAAWLVSPGGTVELVSASRLTRHGRRALHDRCEGFDLLALGAGTGAFTAARCAPIPVLIARPCRLGTEVTDRIVVSVDGWPESSRAVELAGLLAAAHDGTVTILAAPARDPALDRAIAASFRVLLHATGRSARVAGETRPPERIIPSAAAALAASLVILGSGRSQSQRTPAALMIGAIGCSVLVVPGLEHAASAQGSIRPRRRA
jgi:hypothetical protein